MATLFSLIEVIHLKKLYTAFRTPSIIILLLFTTTFFSYFYIFSVYLFLFLCFYVITMFYHFCSIIYISFRFQNIFHIFPNMYFPISTNIYFPISLKTNPLSSLMYPLFCFFVISQVKKTTTKIQGALDEDQESQVINTFSIHIITVYFRSAVCLLPVKPEVCIS